MCAVVNAPLQLATQFGPFLEDAGGERERGEREGKGMGGGGRGEDLDKPCMLSVGVQ